MADDEQCRRWTQEQAHIACDVYEQLVMTMTAANNELLRKLSERPDLTDDQTQLLNEWSLCCIELNQAAALQLEYIAATVQ